MCARARWCPTSTQGRSGECSQNSSRHIQRSVHINRLDIDELSNAKDGELAPVTRLLDAAEGEPRIRFDEIVHEADTRLQALGSNTLALGHIAREHGRTEAEVAVV